MIYRYVCKIYIFLSPTPPQKSLSRKTLPKAYEEWDKVTPADLRGTWSLGHPGSYPGAKTGCVCVCVLGFTRFQILTESATRSTWDPPVRPQGKTPLPFPYKHGSRGMREKGLPCAWGLVDFPERLMKMTHVFEGSNLMQFFGSCSEFSPKNRAFCLGFCNDPCFWIFKKSGNTGAREIGLDEITYVLFSSSLDWIMEGLTLKVYWLSEFILLTAVLKCTIFWTYWPQAP